ncbi:MAG: hypothetical protein EZS28_044054 [Streblomastix strix]|uniref:Uncharacterized protein n=1 Tax=Streblomastix strix TaxID=222440 RepID=A0A5J4TR84_9EUKA|nr:MAG: hypothetical protein EZS28_044054 [Streblomastix strix]
MSFELVKMTDFCVDGDSHLAGTNKGKFIRKIIEALSRPSRAVDYKLKEKIFQQTCHQMNLNPTIDLFSQLYNNLLPRFKSTIRGHGEIAIYTLNQKNIKEERIKAMIIAPLWSEQIWYIEPIKENVQSLMLGWSSKILEPKTSLIKKNLKLLPVKICCFLMD